MTEEEAKTKWCPHVRYLDIDIEGDQPCNRHRDRDNKERGYNPIYSRCIGSACMAWRKTNLSKIPMNELSEYAKGDGYCGLAGKP